MNWKEILKYCEYHRNPPEPIPANEEFEKIKETECPKCKGKGCSHCDGKGYHKPKKSKGRGFTA